MTTWWKEVYKDSEHDSQCLLPMPIEKDLPKKWKIYIYGAALYNFWSQPFKHWRAVQATVLAPSWATDFSSQTGELTKVCWRQSLYSPWPGWTWSMHLLKPPRKTLTGFVWLKVESYFRQGWTQMSCSTLPTFPSDFWKTTWTHSTLEERDFHTLWRCPQTNRPKSWKKHG